LLIVGTVSDDNLTTVNLSLDELLDIFLEFLGLVLGLLVTIRGIEEALTNQQVWL